MKTPPADPIAPPGPERAPDGPASGGEEAAPREPVPPVVERSRELDHAHRLRASAPGLRGLGPVLGLRFLRGAVRGWLRPPRQAAAVPVAPPERGAMCVTFVGHATVMITTPRSRVLTDPLFALTVRGLRRAEAPALDPVDRERVSLVLVSHPHRDHLHLRSLAALPRGATLVVPPHCAALVAPLGFREVVERAPGERLRHRDVEVSVVAARHDGRRGLFDRRWRGANGYVVRAEGASAYFAGATGYFSGFGEIGRRLRPDVALLPIAGYEPPPLREQNMSPLDAVAAFEDLGASLLIPIAHGALPTGYEPLEEPLRWLREIVTERGLAERVRVLAPGETLLVRGRVDGAPPLV